MRSLTLYLRSRSVPLALTAAAGSALALWSIHHIADDPRAHTLLALLAVVAGTAAFAPGLAGADLDLEETAAIDWRWWRAAHVVFAGAAVLGLLAAAQLSGDALGAASTLARNVSGLGGVVALGAAVLGAARASALSVGWTLLVLPLPPPAGPAYKLALTWMVQPAGTAVATATAAVLGLGGTVAYAILGSRR
jgi:hypothetical protein